MSWTVIEKRGIKTLAECKCGNRKEVYTSDLKLGKTTKCSDCKGQTNNFNSQYRGTKVYRTWVSMKQRCYNPNIEKYIYYGGRGITVSDKWLGKDGFKNFLEEVGQPPSPKHSIDRINNDKNYEPSNVKWSTQTEQRYNARPRNQVIYNERTSCRKGHPYTDETLYIDPSGERRCRICQRSNQRASYHRNKVVTNRFDMDLDKD